MEPSAAISVIETDLRRVVRIVLAALHGDRWMETAISQDVTSRLRERWGEEAKRRAPALVPSDLLAYTHLYELRSLIEKNWQSFAPVFGEKKEFATLLDKAEDFRNAPSHSRELLPHERSLLDGIAGTLRTKVTVFLSSQAPDAKHYPVIESIRDSFGNTVELLDPEGYQSVQTGLRLQV